MGAHKITGKKLARPANPKANGERVTSIDEPADRNGLHLKRDTGEHAACRKEPEIPMPKDDPARRSAREDFALVSRAWKPGGVSDLNEQANTADLRIFDQPFPITILEATSKP